jgi:hypothetical protein
MQDINADGMVDLLIKKHGKPLRVQFNLGGRFAPPVTWETPDWGFEITEFVVPLGATLTFLPEIAQIITQRLTKPDVLAGTGFFSRPGFAGRTIGGFGTIPIPIIPSVPGLWGIIGPSFSKGKNFDSYELSLVDINGGTAAFESRDA